MKKRGLGARLKKDMFGNIIITPALIFILIFLAYPLAMGIGYSLTNYSFMRPDRMKFTFLKNFITILTSDKKFYGSMGFTFVYSLGISLISYALGVLLALLLNRKFPGRGFFRGVILLPWIVSNAVAGIAFRWIMNDRYGIINTVLMNLGIIKKPILFFASMGWAKFSVILIGIWKALPFMTITILSAMQGISSDLYEAVSIDGGGPLAKFRYITLPGVLKVSVMVVTLQFIWMFNNFESIYLLTSGGPNDATYTLPIYIYNTAFYETRIGYGSAVAVLDMILLGIMTFLIFRIRKLADET